MLAKSRSNVYRNVTETVCFYYPPGVKVQFFCLLLGDDKVIPYLQYKVCRCYNFCIFQLLFAPRDHFHRLRKFVNLVSCCWLLFCCCEFCNNSLFCYMNTKLRCDETLPISVQALSCCVSCALRRMYGKRSYCKQVVLVWGDQVGGGGCGRPHVLR